ncbi:hypothetical protein [uncultured Corynebacterium sp.]|uniref:hypothetical protein n=1 Tax=uncultured Corynebacterium sp. TaxID=159447 RepID=UPI0025D5F58B|nr:hypothetical protein [uncultured Corynebacterium sp.]
MSRIARAAVTIASASALTLGTTTVAEAATTDVSSQSTSSDARLSAYGTTSLVYDLAWTAVSLALLAGAYDWAADHGYVPNVLPRF